MVPVWPVRHGDGREGGADGPAGQGTHRAVPRRGHPAAARPRRGRGGGRDRGDGTPGRAGDHLPDAPGRAGPVGGVEGPAGAAVRLPGRGLFDLPGEGGRRRGKDGPQLRPGARRASRRVRAHLPVQPGDRPAHRRLRRLIPVHRIASSSARSSAVGSHAPAATLAATCSGVVAPAITLATVGLAARPPIATSSRLRPRASAYAWSASTLAHGALASRSRYRSPASRVPGAGGSPRRYLPLSRPEASGKNGSRPSPKRSQAGITSVSASRATRLYWFCALTNGVRCPVRAVHPTSAICQPAKLELPRYRTLPARTRSSRVDRVSSIGVRGSGACIWYRSR